MNRSWPCAVLRAALVLSAVALAWGFAAPATLAGGYGERLSNGSFEEGFGSNGVGTNWVGFQNGGAAFFHFQDDTAPALASDGAHSQLLEISTVNNYVSDPERFAGIYQTVSVVSGTPYTLTLHGMLRVLADDPDMNNWSYVVQWGIDPNGGADWNGITWNDVPWQNTYDWQKPGPLSDFTTSFTAPSNKITLFVRALKKFATIRRDLFVNLDGISLTGLRPGNSSAPQVQVAWPSLVYTGRPFPVLVTASDSDGLPNVSLYDDDALAASAKFAAGPLSEQLQFVWTPTISGTHTLRVDALGELGFTTSVTTTIDVVPIAEFFRNGNFEGGFVGGAIAKDWGFFNNGGTDVWMNPYDDTWPPVVAGGQHAQLISINTSMYGYHDPYQMPDRYAGICQVVTGLTPGASYYVSGSGLIRVSNLEDPARLDDWSYVAQWGYQTGANPDCSNWNGVTNWQTLPWQHVDYRDAPTKINSFAYFIFSPGDTLTVYFRAWKKWAFGQREMLLNLDNLSFAGYAAPPAPTPTPTLAVTNAAGATPTPPAPITVVVPPFATPVTATAAPPLSTPTP